MTWWASADQPMTSTPCLRNNVSFSFSSFVTYHLIVQFYLPKYLDLNRDFYKAVFAGKKKLLHVSEVKHINVPRLQELSVKNLGENLKQDPTLSNYLPEKWEVKKKLDREWVLNVVNSIHPGYLEQVIQHAQRQRQTAQTEEEEKDTIQITEEWKQRLAETTFISSK